VNPTAKLEISVLSAALTLGILGDALLRCFPWGVNFALWAGLFAAAIFFLGRARPQAFARGGAWLLLPIALSPLAFLWHESPALKALNVLCLLTALSLAMLRAQSGRLRTSSLMQYALGSLVAGFNAAFGMLSLLLGNREWNKTAGWSELRKAVAVLLGLALAIPPLLIFGALFMGADAVFRSLVVRFLQAVPTHLLLTAFIAYIVGGYLRGLLFGKDLNLGTQKRLLPFSLGAIEMGVLLGLLDLLSMAFVAVQVRYFFGGSALVHTTTGLTYAEYARRGFFQLLAVAALLLPFLLMVHWLLRPDDAPGQRLFKWLAAIQIALLFVIMASAFQRMRLYQAEYGLSEQRLYPTAFMGWLTVVFIWFCLTVLRGQRERFAFGAMVAGFLLVATLHVINPDALIARTNLERARTGHIFDAGYVASLSADAVPEIVAGLPTLNPVDRCTLAKALLNEWSFSDTPDWRSWTISGTQARHAVSLNASTLRDASVKTTR
jgi:hypothetical protein